MRSAPGPSPPSCRKPASVASPAPTVLSTAVAVLSACQAPVPVTSSAPCSPRLTSTAPTPPARTSRATRSTSPRVGRWRPASSASSVRLGLIRSGPAWQAAASAGPEASTATRAPARWPARTRRACRSSGQPRGRLPQVTSQSARPASSTALVSSAATSEAVSSGPGSLNLLVVPSASTTATLLRVGMLMGTSTTGTASGASSSASRAPSAPPEGSRARVGRSAAASARATLTPLPPGSSRTRLARCTAPRCMCPTRIVRSRLGFGVTVTITPPPPPSARSARRRRPRRARCR